MLLTVGATLVVAPTGDNVRQTSFPDLVGKDHQESERNFTDVLQIPELFLSPTIYSLVRGKAHPFCCILLHKEECRQRKYYPHCGFDVEQTSRL